MSERETTGACTLATTQQKVESLEDELDSMSKTSLQNEQKAAELHSEIENLKGHFAHEIEEGKRAIQDLEDTLRSSQEQSNESRAEQERLQDKLGELESEKERLVQQVANGSAADMEHLNTVRDLEARFKSVLEEKVTP